MIDFEGFPFVVGWELTLACNLACRHCGSSAGVRRSSELTLEEALGLASQFQDLLVQEVHFTGGEPLLFAGWQSLARLLVRAGITVRMVTNGLLLTGDVAAQLKAAGVETVAVSVDGPEEVHDEVRGRRGAYRAALAGIEHARTAGLEASVITTVHAGNVGLLGAVAMAVQEAGVTNWQVQPLFPFGRSCDNLSLQLSEADFLMLGAFVAERRAPLAAAGISLSPADSFGYFTSCDSRVPEWRGCPAGILSCGITSDGRLKGCLSLPDEFAEGNLRTADLWTEWFREDAFAYNRHPGAKSLGPSCAGCEMAQQCRGGCSAMSYACTGSFHNDPYCFLRIAKESTARADRRRPCAQGT